MFAYEIDYGINEDLVRVEYLLEDRGDLKPSYPRIITIPKRSLTLETARSLVLKDARKYSRDSLPSDNFEISLL